MEKLLIVVDMQNDFIDGALGFAGASDIVPRIKNRIESYLAKGDRVVFTRDTHHEDYMQTQEGKHLPIIHCVKSSFGWEIEKSLQPFAKTIFDKPTFGSIELGNWLTQHRFDEIELCGLVSNICVVSNAVIAKAALPEAVIVVDRSLTASFDSKRHEEVFSILEGIQVQVK